MQTIRGDPDYIPDLTRKTLLPSIKILSSLQQLYLFVWKRRYGRASEIHNEEYLSGFDRAEADSEIPMQAPFKEMQRQVVEYSISPQENPGDKTYLSLNYATGLSTDPFLYLAFNILQYLLLDNPAAPLKKALLEAGIGKDVFGSFGNYLLQPSFSVIAKDANEDDTERFLLTIDKTLRELAAEGIDKKLVEAAINYREFKLREADFGSSPKGLVYGIRCLDSWLYGADPTIHLRFEHTMERIKKALSEPLFEQLIEKYLLNNTHRSLVVVNLCRVWPRKGSEIHEKLQAHKAKLSKRKLMKSLTVPGN